METAHGAKLRLGGCKGTARSCRPRRSLVEALEHEARPLLPAGSAGSSPEQGCRDSVHTSKDEAPVPRERRAAVARAPHRAGCPGAPREYATNSKLPVPAFFRHLV